MINQNRHVLLSIPIKTILVLKDLEKKAELKFVNAYSAIAWYHGISFHEYLVWLLFFQLLFHNLVRRHSLIYALNVGTRDIHI